jgi:hypothetical protein
MTGETKKPEEDEVSDEQLVDVAGGISTEIPRTNGDEDGTIRRIVSRDTTKDTKVPEEPMPDTTKA